MDSKDFERSILPDRGRAVSDMMLKVALAWVGANAPPEYVYDADQLAAWALRNGYEKRDNTEACALLREARAFVPAPSSLSTAMNDFVVARRSLA